MADASDVQVLLGGLDRRHQPAWSTSHAVVTETCSGGRALRLDVAHSP